MNPVETETKPAAPASPLTDETLLSDLEQQAAAAAAPPAAPAEPKGPPTSLILEGVLAPVFLIFAPNWNVKRDEVKLLAEAYGGVIDKYFPDGLGDFGPEIAAITITGMIVVPRLNTPMKAVPKEKAADDARTG